MSRRPAIFAGGLAAAFAAAPALTQPTIAAPGPGMVEAPCPAVPDQLDNATFIALNAYNETHDWAWLCRYQTANAALKERPIVVFMGDSISEYWEALDPALFTSGVIDRGISGQTTPQMVLRFRQDVVALRPKAVHIMAGTNDIAGNTGPESPEMFKNNIRTMVDLARVNGIAVVLGAIPPAANFHWVPALQPAGRIAELNRWLKSYAAQRKLVFADYHGVLATPEGAIRPEASADGVHPNAAGYALMRPVAERAIAAALKAAR